MNVTNTVQLYRIMGGGTQSARVPWSSTSYIFMEKIRKLYDSISKVGLLPLVQGLEASFLRRKQLHGVTDDFYFRSYSHQFS
jgi:hypothetical protein